MKEKTIDQIIADFKAGDTQLMTKYYKDWKNKFIGSLMNKHSQIAVEELLIIYDESFSAVYHNIRKNKFENQDANVFSYLCSIGEKKLYTLIKKEQKYANFSKTIPESFEIKDESAARKQELQEIANKLIQIMGEPCKTILMDFYINQIDIRDIAHKLQYTEGSLKNKKGDCLKKAKEALRVQFDIKGNWI